MKLSDPFTTVPSVMTRKLGTALAVGAVAMCLLLGAGMAQAQTVEKDGDTVTAIRGLQFGNVIYDVEFPRQSGETTYDFNEAGGATFDFNNAVFALGAVRAVNEILTDEGVSTVGVAGFPPSTEFNIGYEAVTEGRGVEDVTLVLVELGKGDPNSPGAWLEDNTSYNISDSHTWADFTIVDFAGDGNLSPLAAANGQYTGLVGENVAFDSTGSTDLDGTIVAYEWDFGDGSPIVNGPTPSHTYMASGAYFVTLTVTDDNVPGAPDSDYTTALIAASVAPVADPNGPYIGRRDQEVFFDGSGSSDLDGTIVDYAWDFGDSNDPAIVSGPSPTASHTYTTAWQYKVTLTVTDETGEVGEATTTATIGIGNLPPVADAGSTAVGSDSMTRNFDGSQSVDPNVGGSIVAYSWDFGDGTPFGSGETTSHTYTSFGNFNVTLTVTDNEGKTDSDNTLAVIEPPPPCDCDLNSDGSCDESDWLLFFPDWERTDCNETDVEPCECDLNDDGSCDFSDLVLFFSDWGRDDCPAPVD